tara:strand:+ start:167 stop:502 length:336 start_codon:yes stop_codon:yes gene_type:complete
MPLITISTSLVVEDKKTLLEKSSQVLSELTKKPEMYVMVRLIDSLPMYFGGDHRPSCYVDIKSIGSLNPSIMSKPITQVISSNIEIPEDRIYINFENIEASMWAWKSRTFG